MQIRLMKKITELETLNTKKPENQEARGKNERQRTGETQRLMLPSRAIRSITNTSFLVENWT